MLYHIGARNFECHMCGNKFYQMEHLKRHLLSIHNLTQSELASLNLTSSSNAPTNSPLATSSTNEPSATSTTTTTSPIAKRTAKSRSSTTKEASSTKTLNSDLSTEEQQKVSQASEEIEKTPQPPQPQPSSCKVMSKCIYKCPKCEEYTFGKLLALNQHIINKHSKELVHFMSAGTKPTEPKPNLTPSSSITTTSTFKTVNNNNNHVYSNDRLREDDDDDSESDEEDEEEDEEEDDDDFEEMNNNRENDETASQKMSQSKENVLDAVQNLYLCAFCYFRTNQKVNLNVNLC